MKVKKHQRFQKMTKTCLAFLPSKKSRYYIDSATLTLRRRNIDSTFALIRCMESSISDVQVSNTKHNTKKKLQVKQDYNEDGPGSDRNNISDSQTSNFKRYNCGRKGYYTAQCKECKEWIKKSDRIKIILQKSFLHGDA